jgi:carboxyl-terminal processing protease
MTYPVWHRPRPFLVYSCVVLAFLLGGISERYFVWVPGSTPFEPAGLGRTFRPFWEAWNLVDEHYVDREAVNHTRMTEGSIEGMLDSLGDHGHTTYVPPDEFDRWDSVIKGEMKGIGVRMTMRKGQPTVMSTFPGAPADGKLKRGDIFLQVNGKSVTDVPLERVVELVRSGGDRVSLRVLRPGRSKPIDVTIQLAKIEIPEVTWHVLPRAKGDNTVIAHLAIENFGEKADGQLRNAIRELRDAGVQGLIVDVRGNPGGLKDQAVAVTSEFLKDGNVFLQRDARGHVTPVPVRSGGVATDIPLVVLIDEGTASSAEIFAGALQDHKRGPLVGTKTYGTGTVLKPYPLSDGGAVLLAIAEWLTPNGRQIWHHGIEPDVKVTLPANATILLPELEKGMDAEALAKSKDTQLLKALEVLKKELAHPRPAAETAAK